MGKNLDPHLKHFKSAEQTKLGAEWKQAAEGLDLEGIVKKAGDAPEQVAGQIADQYYKNMGLPAHVFGESLEAKHGYMMHHMGMENYNTFMQHLEHGQLDLAIEVFREAHVQTVRRNNNQAKLALLQRLPWQEKMGIANELIKENSGLKDAKAEAVAEDLPRYIQVIAGVQDTLDSLQPLRGKELQNRLRDSYTTQLHPLKKGAPSYQEKNAA